MLYFLLYIGLPLTINLRFLYNLYAPYATLYMYAIEVKDRQIGVLMTISMIFQGIAALFGGIAVDMLGRRKCIFIFDIISLPMSTLIWTFSKSSCQL